MSPTPEDSPPPYEPSDATVEVFDSVIVDDAALRPDDDAFFLDGTLLDERYEIVSLMARGGMGEVYIAKDHRTPRQVAIKVLLSTRTASATSHERFIREARVMSQLALPGVVRVFDFGFTDGFPYLVMERLEGRSVDVHIRKQQRLPPVEVAWIGHQTLDALAAIHDAGYVHRDIKPSNLFLTEVGGQRFVKLLDFGLTRSLAGDATRLTRPGAVIGTPAYMAPATIRLEDLGPLVDLYATGVTLYEAISGKLPYDIDRSEPVVTIFRTILQQAPRPVREVSARVPKALAAVIDRAISRDPADGFQSAREMQKALQEAVDVPIDSGHWEALIPRK